MLDNLLGDTNQDISQHKAIDPDSYNPFAIRNERPQSVLGSERETYEGLCRGDIPDNNKVIPMKKKIEFSK